MMNARDDTASTAYIWTVTQLCTALGDAFSRSWPAIAVQGEVSAYTLGSSGHAYFTLKDAQAQLRCVIYRRQLAQLAFTPCDGQRVTVRASASFYAARGDLQLQVQEMQAVQAVGDLHARFLQLKEKLAAEGLFDARRKRPMPSMPFRIGLATSAQGAAVHDVSETLRQRAPHIRVVFTPCAVQGVHAAQEIMASLRELYRQNLDAILLVRGGGSAEDLAAFNDEALARLIAQAPVPIMTGIGHETDFTIADFVADARAATPTAAAQLCAPAQSEVLARLTRQAVRLRAALEGVVNRHGQQLDTHAHQLIHARTHTLHDLRMALLQREERLRYGLQALLRQAHEQCNAQLRSLSFAITHSMRQRQLQIGQQEQRFLRAQIRQQHAQSAAALGLLHPKTGARIESVQGVALGDFIYARLSDGQLTLRVEDIVPALKLKTPPARKKTGAP